MVKLVRQNVQDAPKGLYLVIYLEAKLETCYFQKGT